MYLIANGKVITRDDAMPYIENGGVVVDGTKAGRDGGPDGKVSRSGVYRR